MQRLLGTETSFGAGQEPLMAAKAEQTGPVAKLKAIVRKQRSGLWEMFVSSLTLACLRMEKVSGGEVKFKMPSSQSRVRCICISFSHYYRLERPHDDRIIKH